jgi:hypothetical protein
MNARFLAVVTRWQVRPLHGEPHAVNDHQDHRWDDRLLDDLASRQAIDAVGLRLTELLDRCDGYGARYLRHRAHDPRRSRLGGRHDPRLRHKVWFGSTKTDIQPRLTRENEA